MCRVLQDARAEPDQHLHVDRVAFRPVLGNGLGHAIDVKMLILLGASFLEDSAQ